MTIWNPDIECASRDEIEALQLKRVQETVERCYTKVSWYKDKFDAIGLKPSDIKSLKDIQKIPFTDKTALRDTFPYGMFAVDIDEIVRLHASSGTTGKPIVVGYTQHDLDNWTECISRIASAAGVDKQDRAQMAFLYGMFTGGWGLHYGLENIGAMVIPAGAGNTEQHIQMMIDYGTTVLISTPSYALYLAEKMDELGVKDQVNLRVGLFGGEKLSEALKREVEDKLGIVATSNYGLTEVMGPGVSGECLEDGTLMHINEDYFYVEIIDPETEEVLEPGEEGELVITTLAKEAFPVLRFRTHDITRLHYDACACGRTSIRMEQVQHRTDDMLVIRGVNIFPSQFESVLAKYEAASPQWKIVVRREKGMDYTELHLEINPHNFEDSMARMEQFRRDLEEDLHKTLHIRIKVLLVEPGSLKRTQGKSKRVEYLRSY
ncbi:MAG: phenylacetate--CoA ligase [Coriobacteriia bacterium]|nr:phenylacetate--CoA ligase [Coriobacteriia bacterium]